MQDKKSTLSLRKCEVVQYARYLPYECTYDALKERIEKISSVKKYCVGIHDKDIKEDGTPKDVHFHAYLTLSQPLKVGTIAKAFEVEPQYVNKMLKGETNCFLYASHANNPEKAQYPHEDILANFDYVAFCNRAHEELSETWTDIEQKIEEGVITPWNYYNVLSLHACVKYEKQIKSAFDILDKRRESLNRQLMTVYVYGYSGCGKTTYSKILAQTGYKPEEICIAAAGKNPFDDYNGQPCLVCDDFRSSAMSFSEFLKVSDNHTNSRSAARYHNKSMGNLRLLIVTSIKPLDKIYEGVQSSEGEDPLQILRRFTHVIKMTDDYICPRRFDASTGDYLDFEKTPNPYSKKSREKDNCLLEAEIESLIALSGVSMQVPEEPTDAFYNTEDSVYRGFASTDDGFKKQIEEILGGDNK